MIADLQRQLGIDASFFTQFVLFLLIFSWLQFVYFRPFLALIQRRQSRSSGLNEESAKLEEAAKRAEGEYAEALAAARKRAAAERDRLLLEARSQAGDKMSAARRAAKMKLERAREAAARAAESDLGSLRGQVGSVAALLVEKLTKTRVGL